MLHTTCATRGIAVAPHSLASQSALAVLREGGNAIEAMVAAAATISVVYPHMVGLGGDGFWAIRLPDGRVTGIEGAGPAAQLASREWYAAQGVSTIPIRGPLAANTVAAAVSGWQTALTLSRDALAGQLPLARLLEDAIHYAVHGIPVTASQHASTAAKLAELAPVPGFAARFLRDGAAPVASSTFVQPAFAATLEHLARAGLDDFYRGDLARSMARELEAIGSPLRLADLEAYRAAIVEPLRLAHSRGTLYNMVPPTQGVISLAILGILDRIESTRFAVDSADYVHACVEATKLAFTLRDAYVTDPRYMRLAPRELLADARLAELARRFRAERAMPWGGATRPGDTVWMGAIDANGCAVSYIQSIYHEFGSGVVLPTSHVNWQNRGASFSLDARALQALEPGRKPFHTLNPAMAVLDDGRVMVYGTMGGDGQPQTQCAVFTRHVLHGCGLQESVTAPRWVLGRTWGTMSESLKLEARFDESVFDALRHRGHVVEKLADFDETVGHAGALVLHRDGHLEGAADPRSNGGAAGY